MNLLRHCEVCEKPIPEGQEVVHAEEGDSYCARCVVDLIGGERDALARQLGGAVETLEAIADAHADFGHAAMRLMAVEALERLGVRSSTTNRRQ